MENKVRKVVVNKLEKLAIKIYDAWKRINELENKEYKKSSELKELDKLNNLYNKLEKEMYKYLLEKNVSEDEWYNCELMNQIYDGCDYAEMLEEAEYNK